MFQPGVSSMVPLVAKDVQRANATIKVADSMAMLAGPGVAGVLITLTGAGVVYLIDAATFAVSALCLLLPGWPGPAAASSCFTSPRLSASWAASCCSPSRRYETSSAANSPSPI